MFEERLLGDEDIAFDIFPATPAPNVAFAAASGFDGAVKDKAIRDFTRDFRPIIARPLKRSLGGEGSSLLLIPDGLSTARPEEPSYTVFAVNQEHDLIVRRHIDHLPVRRGKDRKDQPDPKPKERIKYLAQTFLEGRLGEFLDQTHYDRRNNPDISPLFNPEKVQTLYQRPLKAVLINPFTSLTMDFTPGKRPQTRQDDPGPLERADVLHAAAADAVKKWANDICTPDVLGTLEAIPGRQNSDAYSYLNVRLSRKKRKDLKRRRQTPLEIQANRCTVLNEFPILASDLKRLADHTVQDAVDKGNVAPREAVQKYWKSDGNTLSDDVLDALSGLSERDVPAEVAGNFYRVAPYLHYLHSVEQMPQTPAEWIAFKRAVKLDERFSGSYFREKGQTVSELCDMLDLRSDAPWHAITDRFLFEYKDTRMDVADTIMNMAGRIGLSRLAPIMLNMREREGLAPNIKSVDHIISYCDVATDVRREDMNARGKKMLEEQGLCLVGHFYKDVHLKDLVMMQQAFATGDQREWDKDIRKLAVRERFCDAAGKQRIESLPMLPDDLQQENARYEIVPVSTAGQAFQMLSDMRSRRAWDLLEEMVYFPVHFVFCVKSRTGDTEAMCVLDEGETYDGKLVLSLRQENMIGRDDERGDMSNELVDKIQTYIEYVNGLELRARDYQVSRERLRYNAERLVGERASIGHDRRTAKENVQAATKFNASCPEALKTPAFAGLRYSCPELNADNSIYVFLRRTIGMLDPKYTPDRRNGLHVVPEAG